MPVLIINARPIRRLSDYSGISQISLADARSISESIAGSIVAARNRSPGSSVGKSTRVSRSRSGSHSSISVGHSQESSGRSRGSAAMSRKSTKSSRRGDNSSNGSSSGHGSRRSGRRQAYAESDVAQMEWDHLHPNTAARLRRVSEHGEITNEPARPRVPSPLPLPGSL